MFTEVSISGTPITGGVGFSQQVEAGAAFAAYCKAEGPGLRGAVVLDETYIYIVALDQAGNVLPSTTPNLFSIYIVPTGELSTYPQWNRFVQKQSPVDFDGTKYIARFTPTFWEGVSYDLDIYVFLREGTAESLIFNMPKTIEVNGAGEYGVVDPLQCVLEGTGLVEAVSGVEAEYYVTLQNSAGVRVPYTADTSSEMNLGPWPWTETASTPMEERVTYGRIVRAGSGADNLTATDYAREWNLFCGVAGEAAPSGVLAGTIVCSYFPELAGDGSSPAGDYELYIYIRADASSQAELFPTAFDVLVVANFSNAEMSYIEFSAATEQASDAKKTPEFIENVLTVSGAFAPSCGFDSCAARFVANAL